MAYCRWSSDFFECDVYVYEDVSGGWTTHVAGHKRPVMPDHIKQLHRDIGWGRGDDKEATIARYNKAIEAEHEWLASFPHTTSPTKHTDGTPGRPMIWLDDSVYRILEQEEAGKTFHSSDPGECAELLKDLKSKGFNVPQYAIDALLEEQKEIDDAVSGGAAPPN